MIIKKLKEIFLSELKGVYPKPEIQSFFNLLTNYHLELDRIDIALDPKFEIKSFIEQKFHSALADLKKEIPIQYIIGETEFYDLKFKVNKHVLIPRQETEELIEWVINEVKSEKLKGRTNTVKQPGLKILDIGTGSGCISISLANKLTFSEVWALDISDKALNVAKRNADLNNVHIEFLKLDILIIKKLATKFDIIVSNPPYVRELEKKQMKSNVLKYEPHSALFVEDNNALLYYDKIADFAKENLTKNGLLYFEINQYFGKDIIELLKKKSFQNIELRKDIYGADRMVKATI
jgi:release factor glutamine methyltransferase